MRIILKIARTELATLFYSPIAWFILILFSVIAGSNTVDIVHRYTEALELSRQSNLPYSMTVQFFCGPIGFLRVISAQLFMYIPLLTMGLISRELSSGSIKLLLSSPLKSSHIVFGKYLGTISFGLLLMIVPFISVAFTASIIPDYDWGTALTGMLGLVLLILTYCAVGLFMSSLTTYQVVAAMGTLAVLAGLSYVGSVGQEYDSIRNITYWLSVTGRTSDLFSGVVRTADIAYFTIVIGLFLTLTVLRMSFASSSFTKKQKVVRYGALCLTVFVLGYISSLPSLCGVIDTTNTKGASITPTSKEFVSQLEGKLTITNYINLLDNASGDYLPNQMMRNARFWEQYKRAKSDIIEKNVFYYAIYDTPQQHNDKFTQHTKDIRDEMCMAYNFNPALFKSVDEIDKSVDLESDRYSFVRIIEDAKGHKIRLYNYNDISRTPSEREITATLKKLSNAPYTIGFLTGHNERAISNNSQQGYNFIAQDKHHRYSLITQGFNVKEIDLNKCENIGDDIKILVIADPTNALSTSEMQKIDDYISKGGDMLLLSDEGHSNIVNPVANKLGLQFEEGVLLHNSDMMDNNFIISKFTNESAQISDLLADMAKWDSRLSSPRATAISRSANKSDFTLTPLLETATPNTWLDKDFSYENVPSIDINKGEKTDIYNIMWAASRTVNDKEQRIIIAGDADFMNQTELSSNRETFRSCNLSATMEIFKWLSHDEYPIDIERPSCTDNTFKIKTKDLFPVKVLFYAILPAIMLLIAFGMWLKRRRA